MTDIPKIKILELLMGPFSALILCIGILYSIGTYIPAIVSRHFDHVDQLMEEHKKDRESYQETIQEIRLEIRSLN